MAAVRDWVHGGRHAQAPAAARRALPPITPEIAAADAHFRFGLWLRAQGRTMEAATHLREAARLHPQSWNMWRQAADLEAIANPDGAAFWERVEALGDRPYYPPPDLPGFRSD
jgi:tetratricopeptide (TPR) repeat protein